MNREVVLDTETTGLDPQYGHRLVEVGCIELINHIPTGNYFHSYINPEREVPNEAFAVHGLNKEFLKDFPVFKEVVDDFILFLSNSPLVIHNAKFDMKFINAELNGISRPHIPFDRAIDTLLMAREKFPGSPASLDALCKRFGVDSSNREKHGALLDSELLSQVYLELLGGKQPNLTFDKQQEKKNVKIEEGKTYVEGEKQFYPLRPHQPTPEEKQRHQKLIAKLHFPFWGRI